MAPGFIGFSFARRIAAYSQKLSDLQIIIWSIFFSFLGYVPFSLQTGLSNLDTIRDSVFLPWNFVFLMGYNILIGVVIGIAMKLLFRQHNFMGDPWNYAMDKLARAKEGAYCIVYTENGLEYKGALRFAGVEEEVKEIIISNPKLILREKDWSILEEVEMGKEMLFTEKDILRVLFFDEIT